MGRIVVLTLLGVGGVGLVLWFTYRMGRAVQEAQAIRRGYLNKKGAALLERADSIMKELGVTSSLEEVEILTPQHKKAVEQWHFDYTRWRG